jgi:membrane protein DedA with SNARE-associated domain
VFSIRALLLTHGYAFLFSYILAVQCGVPAPADPLLLIMGALAGDHLYSLLPAIGVTVVASLLGDTLWYELGRIRGRSVLRLLCKLSLEPDTCVRATESTFGKRGAGALLFAKFVPGMSLISMPLCGMTGMPHWRFLLLDAAGTSLWAFAYLVVGFVFHRQLNAVIAFLGLLGRQAGITVALLLACYVAFKVLQRWLLIRELRINRITPEALSELLRAGQKVTIVDLRHPSEIERDGTKLSGALIFRPDDLRSRSHEIPREHEIILYCT